MNATVAVRFESDLAALEACVERAGLALVCRYASAEEFENENVVAWRLRHARDRRITQTHLALGATAVSAAGLLLAILVGS
jgi:hypothetical protein